MIAAADPRDLRRRAWRWHFLAALLVIPFVLWQSVTGVIYLWSEAWVDHRHADLRFVERGAVPVVLDAQVEAARAAHPGLRIGSVRVPADPARSTEVLLTAGNGLPLAAYVDPYRGVVLGSLSGVAWPAGWSRALHGGWPLGDAGSWLLEIGACWALVMVLTGLYLWWPRDGRGLRALLPRLRSGRRTFWRDLHACVAVWFSLLIVLFLLTAMPWTHFWGGQWLAPLQRISGQQPPRAAGFAPVFAGADAETGATPDLQAVLARARAAGLDADLVLTWIDGPPGAAVAIREATARTAQARYLLADRGSGRVLERADWSQFPPLAKAIATGVDVHEGRYFGRPGPWINTLFALVLVWLCVTGAMAWWRRRPARSLGVPPAAQSTWPSWLRIAALLMFALLPLLAASAAVLWLTETVWSRMRSRYAH